MMINKNLDDKLWENSQGQTSFLTWLDPITSYNTIDKRNEIKTEITKLCHMLIDLFEI